MRTRVVATSDGRTNVVSDTAAMPTTAENQPRDPFDARMHRQADGRGLQGEARRDADVASQSGPMFSVPRPIATVNEIGSTSGSRRRPHATYCVAGAWSHRLEPARNWAATSGRTSTKAARGPFGATHAETERWSCPPQKATDWFYPLTRRRLAVARKANERCSTRIADRLFV